MLPTPKITNANIHPEKLCAYKILRFLLCLWLVIFQLMGEAAPPRAEMTGPLGMALWPLEEMPLSLFFLAVLGKKSPRGGGDGQLSFIHLVDLSFAYETVVSVVSQQKL